MSPLTWFRRKRPAVGMAQIPMPPPRELTGIEKMEIERSLAEQRDKERSDAKVRLIIAAKRAAIKPQLDEIDRLEGTLDRKPWYRQQMQAQANSQGGFLGNLLGNLGRLQ